MGIVALADFGSTYTKVTLVRRPGGEMLARAQAPTSTATDLMDGYAAALAEAKGRLGARSPVELEIAASSAGGGLRVAAIGLAADLTAAAARQVALNAGARICLALAGSLGEAEREQLRAARPEIVLFAGGTDGGRRDLVLDNARQLAACGIDAHVVVACNAEIAAEVVAVLDAAGLSAEAAANVMPRLGELEVEAAREAISRGFLEHVIRGKGLSARPDFERIVKMPTPEAVLNATRLLSRGVGDVIVVDVGGATTDVHSDRGAEPASPGIQGPLLAPPLTLRTVEGDLGLRAGAPGAIGVDGKWLREQLDGAGPEELAGAGERRSERAAWIPSEESELSLDRLLAVSCVTHALNRHCGTMLLTRGKGRGGPPTLVREGPDLREVGRVIGTGGVLARGEGGEEVLRRAIERRAPRSLSPRRPLFSVDRNYVLAASGLLGSVDPEAALGLIGRELLGGAMSERLFDLGDSLEMYERALRVIPGGVGSNDRALVDPHPIYVSHGRGSRIWDVDGNEYVDYLLGYGPLVLGHANPLLVEAIDAQMAKGSIFGIGHPLEVEVAELLCDLIPSFEQVRFGQSGTEAVLSAIRIARAATGRRLVVKFEGQYHGWADQTAVSYAPDAGEAGEPGAPRPVPMSEGQPEGTYEDVIVAPWNDAEALEGILDRHRDQIAAILTEPLMCNFGVIEPAPGYLERLRELCDRNGAALIFDEVQCGMRLGLRGAQGVYGVRPDLTCLGKALAGGLPVSAVGGRRELMRLIAERRVFQAGTFNTNPLCLAAIPVVVQRLSEPGTFEEMARLSGLLQAGLSELLASIGGIVQGTTTVFGVRFGERPIGSMREAWGHDMVEIMRLKRALRLRGVYTKPTPRDIWYVSTEHTDADVERTLTAAAEAVAELEKTPAQGLSKN